MQPLIPNLPTAGPTRRWRSAGVRPGFLALLLGALLAAAVAIPADLEAQSGGCRGVWSVPEPHRAGELQRRAGDRLERERARGPAPFACDTDLSPPSVRIASPAGLVPAAAAPVRIELGDDVALDASAVVVTLGGTEVTEHLSVHRQGPGLVLSGGVRLPPDRPQLLRVDAWDAAGNRATSRAWLTYDASGLVPRVDAASLGHRPSGGSNLMSTGSLAPAAGAPNAGATQVRGMCLTVAAGDGAAYECGDLRLAHPLPRMRTYNQTRGPTLLYNSQHAHPRPLVTAHVTVPAGAPVPGQVTATLTVAGTVRSQQSWTGSGFTPGRKTQIVLDFDALDLATGVYPYVLEITSWYGGVPHTSVVQDELAVVNRNGSHFGAGWWLAGWEGLVYLGSYRMLWVGGDGSTRVYSQVTPGSWAAWVAPALDRPDTLTYADAVGYTRTLRGGARVIFNSSGTHVRTEDRLGRQTTFAHDAATRALTVLLVPSPTRNWQHDYGYVFTYGGTGGRLSRVNMYAGGQGRVVSVGCCQSLGQLTSITDPDGTSVFFGYQGGRRITQRVDRRGNAVNFEYDAAAKLRRVAVDMDWGRTITGADLVTRFEPQESRGLAGGAAVPVDSAFTLIDGPRTDVVDHTRLWLDRWGGPVRVRDALGHTTTVTRGDPRFPVLVTETVAPNGLTSRAVHNARGNPETVTVLNPLGDGRNAVTRYVYGDTGWPDFPTRVVPPEGDSTVTAYDARGNPRWMMDARGDSTRVDFTYHPTTHLLHQVLTPRTRSRGESPQTYAYDGLNNLSGVTDPLGNTTWFRNDAFGRTIRTVSPPFERIATAGDSAYQLVEYDEMDRVRRTENVGPRMNVSTPIGMTGRAFYPEERVLVQNFYNAAGQPDSVARWMSPDSGGIGVMKTRWRYDPAGRAVEEIAEVRSETTDWQTICEDPFLVSSCQLYPVVTETEVKDVTTYDPAGNAVAVLTRRGHTITSQYDALNRLVRRTTPAVSYSPVTVQVTNKTWVFPHFQPLADGTFGAAPNTGAGLTIPGEVAEFGYDAAGNMARADNGDARVRRGYYPNGLLRADTQYVRTYSGSDFASHTYRIEYEYDLNGRRTVVRHPAQLAPADGTGTTTYGYAPHGALKEVRDVRGAPFTYQWSADGELAARTGTTQQSFAYDAGGRLARRTEMNGPVVVHDETYGYDRRGKLTDVGLGPEAHTFLNVYGGLGAMIYSYTEDRINNVGSAEQYTLDPLGNYISKQHGGGSLAALALSVTAAEAYGYQLGTGRLVFRRPAAGQGTATEYDHAGNQVHSVTRQVTGTPYDNIPEAEVHARTRYYYSADQRLRVLDRKACLIPLQGNCQHTQQIPRASERSAFEEYRYDALGRRVLTRTRQDVACDAFNCVRSLVRTVWDGDQILYEISAPGHSGSTMMELDQGVAPRFDARYYGYGRVAYAHGLGIDDPLSITRVEYSDSLAWPVHVVPQANWSGKYDGGTGRICVYLGTGSTQIAEDVWEPGRYKEPMIEPSYEGQVEHCVEVDWPARVLWNNYERKPVRAEWLGPRSWMGSLVQHGRDASGQYYRRNRFYDAGTGRFTQEDPIGLGGGLNLYGFADGDPVANDDPFGLCREPKGKGVGICIESFINAKRALLMPVGDKRGPRHDGGTYKTSIRFSIDPASGQISGLEARQGRTLGVRGTGQQFVGPPGSDGQGGWNVPVMGWGRSKAMPMAINYAFTLNVAANGDVRMVSGAHDGFPSYEIWSYQRGTQPSLVYHAEEGHIGELLGTGDVKVK